MQARRGMSHVKGLLSTGGASRHYLSRPQTRRQRRSRLSIDISFSIDTSLSHVARGDARLLTLNCHLYSYAHLFLAGLMLLFEWDRKHPMPKAVDHETWPSQKMAGPSFHIHKHLPVLCERDTSFVDQGALAREWWPVAAHMYVALSRSHCLSSAVCP